MRRSKPNVILVVVDALRRDHVDPYGADDLTPSIGEIASEGVVFDQATTTVNATEPAILSLLSGRYPTRVMLGHGIKKTEEERRRAWGVTMAQKLLRGAGYKTVHTGRGLGRWYARGFDHVAEPLDVWKRTEKTRGDRLKHSLETTVSELLFRLSPRLSSRVSRAYHGSTRRSSTPVEDLISYVKGMGKQPFFGMVHLMDTHAGYAPAEEHLPSDLEELNEGASLLELAKQYGESSTTEETLRYFARKYAIHAYPVREGLISAQYRGSVSQADEKISRLVEEIDLESTWIIVCSDHGESLGENGIYYDHHGLYDPTIRIPLIVRPPGGARQKRIDELVQINDLGPTLLDVAGLDPDRLEGTGTESFSLKPLIEGGGWSGRSIALADENYTQRRSSVRTRDRLVIYDPTEDYGPCRYCDLVHDGGVTGGPSDLIEKREELVESFAPSPTEGESETSRDDREAVRRQLEALGYR